MLLTLLALAHADDIVVDELDIDVDIVVADEAPVARATPCDRDHDDDHPHGVATSHRAPALTAQYGMLFLPEAPAHHLAARHTGRNDSYVSGDLRYLPDTDLLWSGRVGAGIDVLGSDRWDLTLGLFVGTAGTWVRTVERAVLTARPIGGTEIGLGVEGERLFARYRWVAGLGTGDIDDLMTENELTVGYRVMGDLGVYGQYLRLNPGEAAREGGVGIGVRATF
jgi:hypothetical protein